MPKISVIVPIYKVETYLRRCIDSVLAQTYTDFEAILVDDGSPDNCGKICDEYATKDGRIVVIHKENRGLSSARNAGIDWAIANSNSEWICFIDSDDWVSPYYLEYLHRATFDNNVKISACDVFETTEEDAVINPTPYKANILTALEFYKKDERWATVAWNKLYSKEIFESYRYPVGRIHEDEFLTYRLLFGIQNIAWLDAKLYYYYRHDCSIMGTFSIKRLDVLDAIEQQCDFFANIDTEIFKSRAYLLLEKYNDNIAKIREIKEYRSDYKFRKKELKRIIRKYKKVLNITIVNTPQFYNCLYPKFIKFYFFYRRCLGKIKRLLKKSLVKLCEES